MLNNIAFIGGIHGVGKSTACKEICDEVQLIYLSASELLKWKDVNEDVQNKKVKDIQITQDKLLVGLENTIMENKSYLLDGHYCLLNRQNEIVKVPLDTFQKIRPVSLNLILGDINEIKSRLEKRDGRSYEKNLLQQMQDKELTYAKYLSNTLGVTLNVGTQNNYSGIKSSLLKIFSTK
jgi:adenylate kinase